MNVRVEEIKEAWNLLSDTEKDFLKNCGLLAKDTATVLVALRGDKPVRTRSAIAAVNHIRAFFELAIRIKEQKDSNMGAAFRAVHNGNNISFSGKTVANYYIDNDMIDIFRDVMTGRL